MGLCPSGWRCFKACSIVHKSFTMNYLFTSKTGFSVSSWDLAEDYGLQPSKWTVPTWLYFYLHSEVLRPWWRTLGGLVFRKCFQTRMVNTGFFSTFELQIAKVGHSNPCWCILIYVLLVLTVLLYRHSVIFLSSIITLNRVIMVGDLNIQVDEVSCNFAIEV